MLLCIMGMYKPLFNYAQNTCFCASSATSFTNPCSFVRKIHASMHHGPVQTLVQQCAKYMLLRIIHNLFYKPLFICAQTTRFYAPWACANPCSIMHKIRASAHHPQPLLQTLVHLCENTCLCAPWACTNPCSIIHKIRASAHHPELLLQTLVHPPAKYMLLCTTGLYKPLFNYCLLYTSPSPRDRQKSRMPSSA